MARIQYKLKPGTYYIGDPCYAVKGDGEWERFLKATDCCKKTEAKFKRSRVLVFRTIFGDGIYHDNEGNDYAVDSGCLSILPFAIVSGKAIMDVTDVSRVVTFSKDVIVHQDDDGIHIGDTVIDC